MFFRALFATCVVVGLVAEVHAQAFRPGRGRNPEMDPFAAEGTVQAVIPGRIQIQTLTDQTWVVFVDPTTKVHVTGTAEADFLRRGMFIKFSAQVDKRGNVQSPIAELTIFTPSEENPVGIWPAGVGPAVGPGGNNFGAGMGPAPPNTKGPETGFYTVGGQITSERKGKLTVNAGRGVVLIELSKKPTIGVDFADYSVARQGDKISVTRGKMFRGRPGLAQAQELTVVMAQPLTGPRKKPPKPKPIPARPPKQPGKEGSQPDAFKVAPEE